MISVTSTVNFLADRVMAAVYGEIDRRMVDAGNRALSVMHALAPRRTGFLVSQETFTVVDRTLVFSFGAPYDIFQEFGTRNLMPRPHIRPGLEAMGRMLGFGAEMHFNRPGGSQWHGIHATGGMTVVPHGLSGKQIAHVQKHVAPGIAQHHRGNVKRSKMVVRRWD